ETAALMELAGENQFKVRAYENASRTIAGFPESLEDALANGHLREARGIGAAILSNIQELVATGRLALHEELRSRFPPALRECLGLPGLGVQKVRLLHQNLGIDSLDALERACRDGTIRKIKGFGDKSVERLLRGITLRRAGAGAHRFPAAAAAALELAGTIEAAGLATRVEIAGSLRRRREIVRDADLVLAGNPAAVRTRAESLSGVVEVIASADASVRVRLAGGMAADLTTVSGEEFGSTLLFATGSDAHLAGLVERARGLGFTLEPAGLFGSKPGLRARTEEEIYEALRLAWIAPELREGMGEIEAAADGRLPRLVEARDLKGLIHLHTTDSDGRDSLEAMVAAVRHAGYGYAAITDHSKTAAYARGLTEERMLLQRARLRSLQPRFPDIRLFHGTEADILADGSIDFGDAFLEGFDVVVASVHSRFGLDKEEQTRRLIRAVRNPMVSILGHPSGRLLLSREPLSADWESVLAAAAEAGCALEINCNPERLDLDWRLCRQAAEAGILLSIGPDAHSVSELGFVPYGMGIARKGWLAASSVLNAKSANELEEWLERRRGKPLPKP
ncbi:MAG TPA: helix-hairpin-helix domain-containing protein, partial [Thermoanaerobaculia bacterium]